MSDAWDVFVRGISPARLESERFGPTRALSVAKNAVASEAFNTPAHHLLAVRHGLRGTEWRSSFDRKLAEDRREVLAHWWKDLNRPDMPPAPRKAPVRKVKPKPDPKPEPVVKHTPQQLFTARQYEIALAAMDAPKLKPIKYAA